VLTLIDSKVSQPLDYVRLLRQLRFFGHRTKTQWAQEFYGQPAPLEKQEGAT
jgi:CRISPR system Cascade subunit CasB